MKVKQIDIRVHLDTFISVYQSFQTPFVKCVNRLGSFDVRQPEYRILFLKYPVVGLGGIKQPAEDDLRLILVLALFLKVKF